MKTSRSFWKSPGSFGSFGLSGPFKPSGLFKFDHSNLISRSLEFKEYLRSTHKIHVINGLFNKSPILVCATKFHKSAYLQQTRFYATDEQLMRTFQKSQVRRVSIYEPHANELILIIQKGQYQKAKIMVRNENINVNGHNKFENTPLTDAAKRNDCKAIEFLVAELGANLHISCDCPLHKTALHYAAENGHTDAVELLLKLGANPYVLDSRKYTPLDVSKNEKIKQILLNASNKQNLIGLKKSKSHKQLN